MIQQILLLITFVSWHIVCYIKLVGIARLVGIHIFCAYKVLHKLCSSSSCDIDNIPTPSVIFTLFPHVNVERKMKKKTREFYSKEDTR